MQAFFAHLVTAWRHFTCRRQEARRLRRDMRQLEQMSAHELRDIGYSHPAAALTAAANMASRCI